MSAKDYVGEDLREALPDLVEDLRVAFGDYIQTQKQDATLNAKNRLAELEGYSEERYFREEGLVFYQAANSTRGFERACALASQLLSLPADEIKGVELRPTTEQRMSWYVHAWGRFGGSEKRISSEDLLKFWNSLARDPNLDGEAMVGA